MKWKKSVSVRGGQPYILFGLCQEARRARDPEVISPFGCRRQQEGIVEVNAS